MDKDLRKVRLDQIVVGAPMSEHEEQRLELLQEDDFYPPLFVREIGEDQFELLAGSRTLEAARTLGWETIDALAITGAARSGDEQALLINELQESLAVLHKARRMQGLIDIKRYTQSQLAVRLRMEPGNVSHMLKVLRCPDLVAAVEQERLQFSSAKLIASLAEASRAEVLDELRALKGESGKFPPVKYLAELLRQRKGKKAAPPVLRVAPPTAPPAELLPAVLDAILSLGGQIRLEDTEVLCTLPVPRADWERVAALISTHHGATEPVAAAA